MYFNAKEIIKEAHMGHLKFIHHLRFKLIHKQGRRASINNIINIKIDNDEVIFTSLFSHKVWARCHFSHNHSVGNTRQFCCTKHREHVSIHTRPFFSLYTFISLPSFMKSSSCATQTSSCKSPLRNLDLTSN